MFNTIGSTLTTFGGGVPVWKEVFAKMTSGAKLGVVPAIGSVLPAGTPVVVDKVGGTAMPIAFYKAAAAVADVTATEIVIVAKDNYEAPIVGDKIKVLSTGVELTVSEVGEVANDTITLTVSTITAGIAEGAILYLSEHSAVDIDVANFAGLTLFDVYAETGTTAATVAIVASGTVYADRVPFVPQEVKSYIPNIIFEKGI